MNTHATPNSSGNALQCRRCLTGLPASRALQQAGRKLNAPKVCLLQRCNGAVNAARLLASWGQICIAYDLPARCSVPGHRQAFANVHFQSRSDTGVLLTRSPPCALCIACCRPPGWQCCSGCGIDCSPQRLLGIRLTVISLQAALVAGSYTVMQRMSALAWRVRNRSAHVACLPLSSGVFVRVHAAWDQPCCRSCKQLA